MYPVITISREFGSGGHSIGEAVAKQLDNVFPEPTGRDFHRSEKGYFGMCQERTLRNRRSMCRLHP